MVKQKVNLSKLVAGKKGSHVPASSYFAFKGKSLIYTAIKQKGARGGYTSAIVTANIVKKLKGAKSESDVREELDNLVGNPRVVQNKHAITNPQSFDVESRLERRNAFVEVEQDGIDPFEDEDDEMKDNGEGPSDQPPASPRSGAKRPSSPGGEQQPQEDETDNREFIDKNKRPADRGDELDDADEPLAKRPNETDEEFARRLKRKSDRPDDFVDTDQPLPKKDKRETIDGLIERLEELEGGKEKPTILLEADESEDEFIIRLQGLSQRRIQLIQRTQSRLKRMKTHKRSKMILVECHKCPR